MKEDSKELNGSNLFNKTSSMSINKQKKDVTILEPDVSVESVKNGISLKETQTINKEVVVINERAVTTSVMNTRTREGNEIKSPKQKNQRKKHTRIENIFTDEYKKKREREEFKFLNLLLQGNPFINLIRTNTTFHRTACCIMLFLNIYLQMFWSAVFIAGGYSPLIQPEDFRKVTEMVGENMWIPCCTLIFSITSLPCCSKYLIVVY
jgi:hypothetical protein